VPMGRKLSGVFAAAVTPLTPDSQPDLNALPDFLGFLAERGCHGALVLGTTGEGQSFSPNERKAIIRAALGVRETWPDFKVLAGTGCASLTETEELTRAAFDLGADGTVTLPPFYFKTVQPEGITGSFRQILRRSVPSDGCFFFYHIPRVSGVPIPHETIARLRDEFPDAVAGLKDSSADPQAAREFSQAFPDFTIFNGSDSLFSLALEAGASGCITALANIASPILREVWDRVSSTAQERMTAAKNVLDHHPIPPAIKHLLHAWHGLPAWTVRLPLLSLSAEERVRLSNEMRVALRD